ncbi:MAG: extracellular solute-binding protein [Massiliimalia sp.]
MPRRCSPIDVLKEDFLQVEEHLIDGKLYFIDMGVMTSGIFYNKDMWEEAGLTEADIPKTWDDLVAVAQKLTKTDSKGKITREGMALNEGANFLLTALNMQKGNFMFDEEGTALINTPDMKESMQFIVDFYDKYKVSSIDFPTYSESFANQQAAMTYSWGWYGTWLNGDSYKDLNWGFFNLPTVDGETPPAYDRNNGESTAAVSAKTGDKEKAVAFDMLKYFLCNDELLIETNMALSTVPVKLSLQNNETIATNIVLGTQAEILDRTYWPGAVPDPYFQGLLKYVEQDVLLNGKSIDDALENAETVINKDLEPLDFTPVERLYQHASEFKN